MTYQLTPEQLATFTEAFGIFDKDKTGSIVLSNLPLLLRSIGQNPTQSQIAKISEAFGGQTFDLDTFLRITESPEYMQDSVKEEAVLDCLREFDDDAKQTLSVAKLRCILQAYGDKLTDDEADSFIEFALNKADPSKSGHVNIELLTKELIERDPGVAWTSN